MIFFPKRVNNTSRQSSSMEKCFSILGLLLAIGLFGGLGALIYGLIERNSSALIGGSVVLGVSVFFSIIFAIIIFYCFKNNNVNSNENQQRSHTNQRPHKQNHQISSREITVGSRTHNQQSNVYNPKMFSPAIHNSGLTNSTNYSYGKQEPQSPSKISPYVYSNQSNGSIHNQNYQSTINSNTNRNNYNRH